MNTRTRDPKAPHPDANLRIDKAGLFRHLGYTPHPGQAAVHRSTARYRALACGSRWGKSLAAAMEVVAALLQPADKSLGWVVAPTRDLCDRILERVFATFRQHLAHRIVEDDFRHQRLVVRNLGGGLSTVQGKSAENAVSLLGESLDWLIVEEASKLARVIFENHLAARLVDRRGWALLISTPNGPNWFWHLYRRGQRGRDATHESWRSPSWDNPHLDPEAIEEERRRLPKDAFDQEFGAVFLNADCEPCDTCGGPDRNAAMSHVIVTDGDLPRCKECNQLVTLDGRTVVKLWPGGRRTAKVIWLRAEEEPEPEPAQIATEPEPAPQLVPALCHAAPGLDDISE